MRQKVGKKLGEFPNLRSQIVTSSWNSFSYQHFAGVKNLTNWHIGFA
jgi:hypothetical protein